MKTVRIGFTGGVATIPDKAVMGGDNYVTVADNVDLRSGLPKPIKAPAYDADLTSGTKQIFHYNGRTIASSTRRSYVAGMYGNTERIFYTDSSTKPMKMVNGVLANLGTGRPLTPPDVTYGASLQPTNIVATAGAAGSGNLSEGVHYYRIAAKIDGCIMPPSGPISVSTVAGANVVITWSAITDAEGYVIFGRSQGAERVITELAANICTWTDGGTSPESGALASSYDSTSSVKYAYSFVRNVEGMIDEGTLSVPSDTINGSLGRTITFDPTVDGFFEQNTTSGAYDTAITVSSGITMYASDDVTHGYSWKTISTIFANEGNGQIEFTTSTNHGYDTGDKVYFELADENWAHNTFEIIKMTDTKFCVKDMVAPTDTVPVTNGVIAAKTKVVHGETLAVPVDEDNAVYFTGTAVWGSDAVASGAMFRVNSKVSSTAFIIDRYTETTLTSAGASITFKYVPYNGYYKYRRLYRVGDTSSWMLVKELDIWETSFTDATPAYNLGATPDSYYEENGMLIVFSPPPLGLTGLTEHLGMLFGIVNNTIRWTPVNYQDAWPEVYSTPPFEYRPLALISSRGGLIILCEDGLYRLDGQDPSGMTLSKTNVEDGCIAPYSVQKMTNGGFAYLSKRGVMLCDGVNATCITDKKVPGSFFRQPTKYSSAIGHWWIPTMGSHAYASLAYPDGIDYNPYSYPMATSNPIPKPIEDIGSFTVGGKYYLYWMSNCVGSYEANTCTCIDVEADGYPITTMGLKTDWVHVDSLEIARCIGKKPTAATSNFIKLNGYQYGFGTTFSFTSESSLGVWRLFGDESNRIGMFVRTGEMSLGMPADRKRFRRIEFNGNGSVSVRVFVDGELMATDLSVDAAELPGQQRCVNLPSGTKGYTIDIEFSGEFDPRSVQLFFDPMANQNG